MNNLILHSKNIIIILKSFVLGGAEKQALFLAQHLQNNRNCNVYIYAYIKSPNTTLFYKECEKYKLKNLYIVQNPLSAAGRFKYLKRRIKITLFGLKLRKHKPDIIIPYLNPPSIIASLCYKIAGAQITFWHHRGPDYYRNDKLESIAVKKCPLFIANSPDGKNELLAVLNPSQKSTCFTPNFSTVNKINHKKNIAELDKIQEKIIIGMIGHFRVQKLQLLLTRAFQNILNNNIHLVLVGNIYESKDEPSNYKTVLSFIKSKKIEDKVTILHNKNAQDILPYLDIGVLLSKKEGMPNVIMEYMAYGLPVLSTKHLGCVALLGNDYPFYVENNNDVKDITFKLELLVKDKDLRNKLGSQNKQKLQKDFLIEAYLDKLATLINNHL
ncbi:MAG: glycosyltransferase family 4 protein [Flavobacteriaceae bacterium]